MVDRVMVLFHSFVSCTHVRVKRAGCAKCCRSARLAAHMNEICVCKQAQSSSVASRPVGARAGSSQAPPLPEQIQPSDSVGYLYGIRCAREIRSARTGPDADGPHAGEPEDSESAHVYCLVVDWLLTEASFQTKSERVLFRISPPAPPRKSHQGCGAVRAPRSSRRLLHIYSFTLLPHTHGDERRERRERDTQTSSRRQCAYVSRVRARRNKQYSPNVRACDVMEMVMCGPWRRLRSRRAPTRALRRSPRRR